MSELVITGADLLGQGRADIVISDGVIIIATPFMFVLIAMCISLWKSLRQEPYNSTLQPTMRRHMQRHISAPQLVRFVEKEVGNG